MNVCEHLTATARIFPDQIAIRFEGRSYTYVELAEISSAIGAELSQAGVVQGDRVAIMLGNVPAFVVWYYAALRIGAIAVSISTRASASEVGFLLNDCEAKVLVCNETELERLQKDIPDSCATFGTTDTGPWVQRQSGLTSDWVDADPQDPALILYTSGTTGFPKGATLSHANVRSNVCAFNHLCNMQPSDRILLSVPLFHCFGQNALLNSAFHAGATLILQRKFDLNEARHLIAEESVTQLYGVPMMFQLLVDSCDPHELASVRYCFSAAAKLPEQVGHAWHAKFDMPIHEGYGLTETSPFASYNHRLRHVAGSIGTPIDAVEMRIVDTETGVPCPPGELGEIVIRGPNVMLGYWNREKETAEAIRDGWFHSGDIGRVDEQGNFYIVDRVKDMISVGGLKVFPAEVERVLHDHPAVEQVAVVGLPDNVFGEQVAAFVVLKQVHNEAVSLDSIKSFAQQRLSNYKVPRIIQQVSELPRNPSGKILKRELRNYPLATNQAAPANDQQTQLKSPTLRTELLAAYPVNRSDIAAEFVQQLVQEIVQTEELPEPTERFLDVGLDSLMMVEVSNQIQIELGSDHHVPATLLFDYPRLCDLSDYLLKVLTDSQSTEDDETNTETSDHQHIDLRGTVEAMSEEQALDALRKELES